MSNTFIFPKIVLHSRCTIWPIPNQSLIFIQFRTSECHVAHTHTVTHELAVEKTDGSFQPSTLLESSRWYVCGKPLFYHGVKKKAGKQVCLEVQLQPLKTRMDSLAMFTLLYPLFSFSTPSHLYVSSTVQFPPLMILLLRCNAICMHLFRPGGFFSIQDLK